MCILIDVPIPVEGNVMQEGAEKNVIQEFINGDAWNLEHEMHDHTSHNWSHWNSNRFKEKFGRHARKTFNRYIGTHSFAWNITQNVKVLKSET